MYERDLARIGDAAEHALAEKGAAERDPIETADQFTVMPALDAVRGAPLEEAGIELQDLVIDPGVGPLVARFGATVHDGLERGVAADREQILPNDSAQAARHVERIERDDAPPLRIDPEQLGIVGRFGHREDAGGIGAQQDLWAQRDQHRRMLRRCEPVGALASSVLRHAPRLRLGAAQDEDIFWMASKELPHPERDPGLLPGEQSKRSEEHTS